MSWWVFFFTVRFDSGGAPLFFLAGTHDRTARHLFPVLILTITITTTTTTTNPPTVNNWCGGSEAPQVAGPPTACPTGSTTRGAQKKARADCLLIPGNYCIYSGDVCTITTCPNGSFCPGKVSIEKTADTGLRACPACTAASFFAFSPQGATEKDDCSCVSCSDGVKNGDETDIDCGGSFCSENCANFQTCSIADDCKSNICWSNTCACTTCIATVSSALPPAPLDVALDGAGDVFVLFANAIHKMNADGSSQAVATGLVGATQLAALNARDFVFSEAGANRISKLVWNNGAYSVVALATTPPVINPGGVAVDASGVVFIGDRGNQRVLRVNVATGAFVAEHPTPGFTADRLSVSADGSRIFMSDTAPQRIVLWDASFNRPPLSLDPEGKMIEYAGTWYQQGTYVDGNLVNGDQGARINTPRGLVYESATGNLFYADGTNRIAKIAPSKVITTVAGNSAGVGLAGDTVQQATSALLNNPNGVALSSDGRTLYIADTGNNRVRKVGLGP